MLHQIESWDWSVLTCIGETCHNALTDAVFPLITYLGEGGAVWLLLALGLILFGRRAGWRSTGWTMALAMLAGLLIGEIALKNMVCRPRPFQFISSEVPLLIPPPSGYSFPSGHSCSSFAAAVVIFRRDKRFGAGALVLAALIAFSRMFLFVHFPSDVLAGTLLGVLCGLAAPVLYGKAAAALAKRRGSGQG